MRAMAGLAGADTLIWASDFPHSDAKYPGVVDELLEHTADMDADDRAMLVGAQRRAPLRHRAARSARGA